MTKVLVVDDEFDTRESLRGFLLSKGFEVLVAADARAALGRSAEAPDIAIVDMMMPDMDGFQLASRLRQVFPAIRVVMFTGRPSYAADVRAADLGFYGFLPKSNWYDLLVPTITTTLASKEPPRKRPPIDLVEAAKQYVAEGRFELAAGSLEEAARALEFDHEWARAADLYKQAAEHYGRARGVGSMGRVRLDDLAESAQRIARGEI